MVHRKVNSVQYDWNTYSKTVKQNKTRAIDTIQNLQITVDRKKKKIETLS